MTGTESFWQVQGLHTASSCLLTGNTLSDDELQKLSVLLKMPVADLKKKIEDNKRAFGAIYLANDVGVDVATQIEEKKDDFPGIQIEVNPLRVYPLGAAGAQVLGYVGEAGPDDKDADGNPYTTATLIGRAGIERKYNQYLEGKNGSKTIEVNASGQPVGYVGGVCLGGRSPCRFRKQYPIDT